MIPDATEAPWLRALDLRVDLARLEVLQLHLPQVEPFRSAIGTRLERQALFVRWENRRGEWGIGECSCRPDPFFSGEFVAGAQEVLRRYIAPLLPQECSLRELEQALHRVRGWPFTVSAVLDAAFDLTRRQGRPDALDLHPNDTVDRIPVGISLGLFETPEAAVERVDRAVARGYHRVKLKIAPSMNLRTLHAVRESHPDLYLSFDANGSFRQEDLQTVAALARLRPKVIEQPFSPDRLDLCLDLKAQAPDLRICLDESLDGIGSLITAHRLGALDEVNIKPGRFGGVIETCRVLDFCSREKLPAWVGGMFESGVGRLANLRVAARLPGAAAHDLSPSSRYFTRDVVRDPIVMDADGTIDLRDDSPVDLDEETMHELTVERFELRAA